MTLLAEFLKQVNDTSRTLHYARLNPNVLKEKIRKKLKRNRLQELASRVKAIIFLFIVLTGAIWMVMLLTAFSAIRVQIPQDIPNQSDPADFSDPLNIVLYIVLPLLMIMVYILWRRSKKNR